MSRCCAKDNKGTALPSACDSGVTVPKWGVPERFEFLSLTDPLTGVQKFSEWQLAEADTLFRYEYNHFDEFDDGQGAGYIRVDLEIATDDEGTDSELIAREKCLVPNTETEKWYTAVVESIIPAGAYFRTVVYQPLISVDPQGPIPPDSQSVYQHNFATLSAMENQS